MILFKRKLIKKLQNAGAHFWFDKGGIIASNEYAEVIGERLQNASSVLFMISPNAVTSEFVRKELQTRFFDQEFNALDVIFLKPCGFNIESFCLGPNIRHSRLC